MALLNVLQLQYFVATVEAGNLTRACAELGISQPALSRSVRKFEEELGVRLFDRTGRGVELTDSGRRLYQHATAILDHVSQATAALGAERRDSRRAVSFGLPPSIARLCLLPIVRTFLSEHPDVALRITEGYSRQLIGCLKDGLMDVAVLHSHSVERDFRQEELFEEQVFLICQAEGALARRVRIRFAELKDIPLILPTPRNAGRTQVEHIAAEQGVFLRPLLEADSLAATKEFILSGIGSAVLPLSTFPNEIAQGALAAVEIVEPAFVRHLVMATSAKYRVAPEAKRLMEILREHVKGLGPHAGKVPAGPPRAPEICSA